MLAQALETLCFTVHQAVVDHDRVDRSDRGDGEKNDREEAHWASPGLGPQLKCTFYANRTTRSAALRGDPGV